MRRLYHWLRGHPHTELDDLDLDGFVQECRCGAILIEVPGRGLND